MTPEYETKNVRKSRMRAERQEARDKADEPRLQHERDLLEAWRVVADLLGADAAHAIERYVELRFGDIG